MEAAPLHGESANRPQQVKSTVLPPEEEAIITAFRRHTLLPLEDYLYALQPTTGHLSRSSLHRCLQRHGISRLPQPEGGKPARKRFKHYPIGYFHIDIAEVCTAEGKLYVFVAINRASKFAFVRLQEQATVKTATAFLQALLSAVPYKVHAILTGNGIQFCDLPSRRNGPTARLRIHMFNHVCLANDIDHRMTKLSHPWTNGQVERMNRTIKEATSSATTTTTMNSRTHLQDFIDAYNFARRLKTFKGLAPYEHICSSWTSQPNRFLAAGHSNLQGGTFSPCQALRHRRRQG